MGVNLQKGEIMPQWEYLEVVVYGGSGATPDFVIVNGETVLQRTRSPQKHIDVCSFFNQLGAQGWEIVAHTPLGGNYQAYNFKRPKQKEIN